MSSKKKLKEIFFLLCLCLLQVLVLNEINFLGYVNPYFYVVFILSFSIFENRFLFLSLAFLLGWSIDHFMNTFGMHAFSCTLIAFIKPSLTRWMFGKIHFTDESFLSYGSSCFKQIAYLFFLVGIHHLALFLLDAFKFSSFGPLLFRCLLNSVFSMVLALVYFLVKKKP